MREKLIYALSIAAIGLIAWDLYRIFMVLPDEANQGAIYRIIYFHVPAAITAMVGFFVAMVMSALYLITRNLKFDSVAAAVTEVGVVFAAVNLVTGSIWARVIWGIWWTWDARLTSMLICWLLYAGYLMLRRATDEPTQRARLSAVLSIFSFVDVIIVWKSIEWWRTQHPAPVLSIRNGGGMAPGMESPLWWNVLAMALVATCLILLRMRQEGIRRELDALRRYAHAL
ncbi:MAG: cytochrome c biogenesis protein CcsA [Bryobacteraceae bacterium]|jgi:heme exporter protein C